MTADKREAWCSICDAKRTYHKDGEEWSCDVCETLLLAEAKEDEPEAAPEENPSAIPLVDDLDHIRVQLSGPWSNEDLKNLAADLNESALGAKEGGLGLSFFAVKKSEARRAKERGSIIVPFRDRHGNIIPGRALNLKPGEPTSLSNGNGIILPGGKL